MNLFVQHEAEYVHKNSPSRLDEIGNIRGQRCVVTFETNKEISRRRKENGEIYVHEATFLHVDVMPRGLAAEVLTNENMEFLVERSAHIQVSKPAV